MNTFSDENNTYKVWWIHPNPDECIVWWKVIETRWIPISDEKHFESLMNSLTDEKSVLEHGRQWKNIRSIVIWKLVETLMNNNFWWKSFQKSDEFIQMRKNKISDFSYVLYRESSEKKIFKIPSNWLCGTFGPLLKHNPR